MKKKISSVSEFDQIVKTTEEFLLIKHSLTCPVSSAAYEEYEKFEQDHHSVPTYYLFVQDDRMLSTYIAETYSVKHESPQVILFKDGEVNWNASHWNITYQTLSSKMNK